MFITLPSSTGRPHDANSQDAKQSCPPHAVSALRTIHRKTQAKLRCPSPCRSIHDVLVAFRSSVALFTHTTPARADDVVGHPNPCLCIQCFAGARRQKTLCLLLLTVSSRFCFRGGLDRSRTSNSMPLHINVQRKTRG